MDLEEIFYEPGTFFSPGLKNNSVREAIVTTSPQIEKWDPRGEETCLRSHTRDVMLAHTCTPYPVILADLPLQGLTGPKIASPCCSILLYGLLVHVLSPSAANSKLPGPDLAKSGHSLEMCLPLRLCGESPLGHRHSMGYGWVRHRTDRCPQRDQIQTLLGTSQDTECLLAFDSSSLVSFR